MVALVSFHTCDFIEVIFFSLAESLTILSFQKIQLLVLLIFLVIFLVSFSLVSVLNFNGTESKNESIHLQPTDFLQRCQQEGKDYAFNK